MKALLLFVLFCPLSLFSAEITVAVAANVSYVIEPLKEAFIKKYPETKVTVILGSSGKLTAQIRSGAPYHLFLSANMQYPQILHDANMTLGEVKKYATGKLALLSSKVRDFNTSMSVLEEADIEKIAMANPKTAPYGLAAMQALKNAKLFRKLEPKLVYGESVSQTLIYATSAADIGIVAKSALFAPALRSQYVEGKQWKEVDVKLYTPIEQGMVCLKMAKENVEVQSFYDFLLSDEGQAIFKAYGYAQ